MEKQKIEKVKLNEVNLKNLNFKMLIGLYLQYKEVLNYLIFGVLTTIVSLGTKYILLFIFLDAKNPIQLQTSIVISWMIAVIFAYVTNRIYVFNSTNKNKIKEFISFIIARISTLLLEMLIMWFFVTLLKLNSDLYVVIFTLISQVAVVVANYIFSKLFIFKNSEDK